MSAGLQGPTIRSGPMVRRVPPSSNFELYSWVFMRVSGLLLVVLTLVHFAIMHVINDVAQVDYNFVANRWNSLFWRSYDELMLILALLHGGNGMRVVIDDYIRSPAWRFVALTTLWLVVGFLLVVGSIVLFTFEPQPA